MITDSPLVVPRWDGDLHDPTAASPFEPLTLVDATSGATPRLGTRVTLWHDTRSLHLLFDLEDDGIRATFRHRDEPLWKEDVVEVFLAPHSLDRYFEFEVSPLGVLFDAVVDSPDGDRRTMTVDTSWDCEGLTATIHSPSDAGRVIRVSIPFEPLGGFPGTRPWRGNIYRIDRGDRDEFTAWQPTHRSPPDFHVPSSFGTLTFAQETS